MYIERERPVFPEFGDAREVSEDVGGGDHGGARVRDRDPRLTHRPHLLSGFRGRGVCSGSKV